LHGFAESRPNLSLSISARDLRAFRGKLLGWYRRRARPLPWRAARDPYRIWVSEIMLQQTRVAVVIPYYERFVRQFPDAASLAAASEDDLLAAWSGLGYYSRARNLQRAARQIVRQGGFPPDYEGWRRLAGVGDYTAAAVASIAFGEPRAAVDGNVLRVAARLAADRGDLSAAATRRRLSALAQRLLDPGRPGAANQAMMELGATVCPPRQPRCGECPVARFCAARRAGKESEFPVKSRRAPGIRVEETLILAERKGKLLLRRRSAEEPLMAGFWELPPAGAVPGARPGEVRGEFRHSITNREYHITVVGAEVRRAPRGCAWVERDWLPQLPLTTITRKALALPTPIERMGE
jgi:A/G-specific adenine glycosylase